MITKDLLVNPYKNIKKKKAHGVEYLILDHQKSSNPTQLTIEHAELIANNVEGIKQYYKDFEQLKEERITHYIEPNVTIFDEHGMPVLLLTDAKLRLRYVGQAMAKLLIDCIPEIKSFVSTKAVSKQERIFEENKWWDK